MTMPTFHLLGYFLIVGLNVIFCAISATGQCKDKGIRDVIAYSDKISVSFDAAVTVQDNLRSPSGWTVLRITPGAHALVSVTSVNLLSIDRPDAYLFAELTYTGAFERGKKYLLYVENLTFDGCNPKKEAFTIISLSLPPVPGEPTATPTPTPEPLSPYKLDKANARADADIYLSGSIEGVRREKAVKSIDLKVEIPLSAKVFQNDQLIIPYLDLKASSNAKADADSLKTGVILRTAFNNPISGLRGAIPGMVWDLDGRIEGNKNLRFINGLVANKISFIPKVIGDGGVQFYIQPFVGLELGRNLRTPVIQAVDQSVARPNFGADAFFNVWVERPWMDTISVQSEFIRRWSLTREVGVNKSGDSFVPVFPGKGPRDYIQTKFEWGFNKYFGFAVGHEYGRLPPNFKFLEHKFTAGLVFKSKVIFRPN